MRLDQRLNASLKAGYAANVLGRGSLEHAHSEFASHAAQDAGFLKFAKDECERLARISSERNGRAPGDVSAFVEREHVKFLKSAIEFVEANKKTA